MPPPAATLAHRFRAAVPLGLSVLSHGVGVLALAAVSQRPLVPVLPPAASFIELVPPDAEPPAPEAGEEAPPLVAAPVEPRDFALPPPREPSAAPEAPTEAAPQPPDYEREAILADVLRVLPDSTSSFSLLTPARTASALALAATAPDRGRSVATTAPSLADRERQIERDLAGRLQHAANERAYLSQRPPPELRRRADGSYTYAGPRFAAVIEADGTVRFNDNANVNVNSGGTDMGPGLAGSFDITDAVMGANGHDVRRAERRWFLRETRELRERLMDQESVTGQSQSLAGLEGRLRALWAREGSAQAKRRQLFALWADASEDEIGARARAVIEAFVRRQLPQHSEDAFTEGELQIFNRGRSAAARFAPY